jgi:IS1 family transposase
MLSVHRDTIMRLGVEVGQACSRLHDRMMRGVSVAMIEVDEIWSFIGKKQKRVRPDDLSSLGDAYSFMAIASVDKAILSCIVGKRDIETTRALAHDLRSRIVNRPQINTDGFGTYPEALEQAFGDDFDHATLQKVFYAPIWEQEASRRYSPGRIRKTKKAASHGKPVMAKASTSYVERQNLTVRMQMRRFTRLTNGFSKKLENHEAAVALYVAWYNLCRVHETLSTTPAMAIGITDHVWSVEELINTARATPPAPAATNGPTDNFPPPLSRAAVGGDVYSTRISGRPVLRIIRGGLA